MNILPNKTRICLKKDLKKRGVIVGYIVSEEVPSNIVAYEVIYDGIDCIDLVCNDQIIEEQLVLDSLPKKEYYRRYPLWYEGD